MKTANLYLKFLFIYFLEISPYTVNDLIVCVCGLH